MLVPGCARGAATDRSDLARPGNTPRLLWVLCRRRRSYTYNASRGDGARASLYVVPPCAVAWGWPCAAAGA
jgi:hypothetical protein